MSFKFDGVKTKSDGSYYYDDKDFPRRRLPISTKCEGDMDLSPSVLHEWFGISHDTLPAIPSVMVVPRLKTEIDPHSTDWSVVRGSLVVYKPIEWVPSVIKVKTLPKSKAKETYEREITKVDTEKLFGGVSGFVKTSAKAGGSLFGVKLEVETELKVEGKAEKEVTTNKVEKRTLKWEIGDTVIFEVAVAMLLRVEETYVHSVDLSLKNSASANGLTWTGGKDWSEIVVNNRDLSEVEELQFTGIQGKGNGYSTHLWIQVLPVLEVGGKDVKKLHIAVSSSTWRDWYAYSEGRQERGSKDRQLLAWPRVQPISTLLAQECVGTSAA
ncbi:hypothetical protein AB5N19_03525 [Seiridium cardinale]|uniref:Uncharacterized protein n=1 Tax=Seiridium cardinale TaxID=138064 RepID=A0ABR2Y352_9PEZI